jgi:hypothetical protein
LYGANPHRLDPLFEAVGFESWCPVSECPVSDGCVAGSACRAKATTEPAIIIDAAHTHRRFVQLTAKPLSCWVKCEFEANPLRSSLIPNPEKTASNFMEFLTART